MAILLGVFANRAPEALRLPFRAQTTLIRDLEKLAGYEVTVFAFDPNDVDVLNRRIIGWSPVSGRSWISRLYPLPHIVYDRFFSESLSHDMAAKQVRDFFIQSDVKWINHPATKNYLKDKLFVHQILSTNGIRTPKTEQFHWKKSQLHHFISKYKTVYIKPRYGMKGYEIVRINKTPKGLDVFHNDRYSKRINDLESVLDLLNNIITHKADILIQEGISLPSQKQTQDSLTFDIRVLIQKPECFWEIVGMIVRVGKVGAVTSNLATGGTAYPLDYVAKRLQVFSETDILDSGVREVALHTTQVLDKELGGMRDIGVDILLDHEGSLVVLELNSLPGRKGFRDLSMSVVLTSQDREKFAAIRTQSLENILRAARHLASNAPIHPFDNPDNEARQS